LKTKFLKSSFQVGLAQMFQYICGYIIVIALARGLGPAEYGIYGVVISVLLWFEFSSRLGIPQTMAILIPGNVNEAAQYERTALGLSTSVSIFFFCLMFLFAPNLANIFNMPGRVYLFRIAAIDIPFYTIFFVYIEILGGHRQFGKASLRIIVYSACKAIGVLSLSIIGFSVEKALIINIIASIVGILFLSSFISPKKFILLRNYVRPILTLAIPMGIYSVGWCMISTLDLWILRVLSADTDERTIGLYVAATNIAKVPGAASFVMTAVLIPYISKAKSEGHTQIAKSYVKASIRYLLIILLPICTLIALTANDAMALLYSDVYRSGGLYLIFLIFGIGFMLNFQATFCAILIALGEVKLSAFITTSLIPVGVLLNFLLIPKNGAAGAAIAQILVFSVGALVSGYKVSKRFGSVIELLSLLKIIIAIFIIILGTLYSMKYLNIIVIYPLFTSVYLMALMLLKEVTKQDLILLKADRN
jgi:O-antigen/teichoic acid export membrane protein